MIVAVVQLAGSLGFDDGGRCVIVAVVLLAGPEDGVESEAGKSLAGSLGLDDGDRCVFVAVVPLAGSEDGVESEEGKSLAGSASADSSGLDDGGGQVSVSEGLDTGVGEGEAVFPDSPSISMKTFFPFINASVNRLINS